MKWTEVSEPKDGVSYYTHTMCETPLGLCKIEWKSWKETPDYSVVIGINYIGSEYDLDDAKSMAYHYLFSKMNELSNFLSEL